MKEYDVVVIGAGIQGAGVAQAAAAAGYSVLVLEKDQVGSGTSSKSSKLIHGGLRYLESSQFSLVHKSLKERAILTRIAPTLVKLQPFYIPVYKKTKRRPWQIRAGLSLYSVLGGLHKKTFYKKIKKKTCVQDDGLNTKDLQSIYRYYDGQTDDKLLTQAVMSSATMLGVELDCNVNINNIIENDRGFDIRYQQYSNDRMARTRLVINAAGPWVNEVHDVFSCKTHSLNVDFVQGTHIIIDVAAPSAVYYLEADDARAVFVMPYEYAGKKLTLIGTTEKLYDGKADNVAATKEEVDYLMNLYKKYFPENMNHNTAILHSFAGLRVLPKQQGSLFVRPRDTVLHWAAPGLLTLYGGKLTAYRTTASLVVKKIQKQLGKRRSIACTEQLMLSRSKTGFFNK